MATLIDSIYELFKDEDGFLFMCYNSQPDRIGYYRWYIIILYFFQYSLLLLHFTVTIKVVSGYLYANRNGSKLRKSIKWNNQLHESLATIKVGEVY